MRPSFVETMRGTLRDAHGEIHPVAFELKAEAASVRQLVIGGRTRATGLVRAPPWVEEARVDGTLLIGPRRISYRLSFDGPGGTYSLEGTKHPSLRSPLRSMTRMPVVLRGPHGELARGHMQFALADLPAFLRSFLPSHTAQRALDARRRTVERRVLETGASR